LKGRKKGLGEGLAAMDEGKRERTSAEDHPEDVGQRHVEDLLHALSLSSSGGGGGLLSVSLSKRKGGEGCGRRRRARNGTERE
jgi:hypothetical protein